MDYYSSQITKLIETLSGLPGIGSKSAQRLAFHIINMPEESVEALADSIVSARKKVCRCKECCTLTDDELCPICKSPARVIATWIVARNFAGCSVSFKSFFAFELPSLAIFLSFVELTDRTAISALANVAFKNIRTISNMIGTNINFLRINILGLSCVECTKRHSPILPNEIRPHLTYP